MPSTMRGATEAVIKSLLAVCFLLLLCVAPIPKAAAEIEVDVYLHASGDELSWVLDDLEAELSDDGGIGGGSQFSVRREGDGRFGERIVIEALSGDVLIPTRQSILDRVRFYEYDVSRPIGWDALYEARGCAGAGTSRLTCDTAFASGERVETIAPYLTGPASIEIDGPGCSGRNGIRLWVFGLSEFSEPDGYLRNTSGSGYDDGLVSDRKSRVNGCGGDDYFSGGGKLYGDHGDDVFRWPSPGAKIWGGPGKDSIEDGGSPNMEVHGGRGDDYLEIDGWAKGSRLFGEGGNDVISIAGSGSKAWGGPGRDYMYEQGGKKQVGTLYGGPGADRLKSGPGRDRLFGQGGNDQILNALVSRLIPGSISGGGSPVFKVRTNGVDEINCGAGNDFAVTASGARARGCEKTKRTPYLVGPFGEPVG